MSNTTSPAQVIVITGASDGIGAEMARQLARQHGKSLGLVLAARTAATLQVVAAQCEALGAQCLVVPTDVAVQAQCQALIAGTVKHFGRIDGLINNAGISAQALFAQVRAEGGGVAWPNGADLCPDVLIWGGMPPADNRITYVNIRPPHTSDKDFYGTQRN